MTPRKKPFENIVRKEEDIISCIVWALNPWSWQIFFRWLMVEIDAGFIVSSAVSILKRIELLGKNIVHNTGWLSTKQSWVVIGPGKKAFKNIVVKVENAVNQHFSLFQLFSTLLKSFRSVAPILYLFFCKYSESERA